MIRFLERAREAAGGTAGQLGQRLEPKLGYRPSDKTIRSWLRGERNPSGEVLMAAVAALADKGLSFDQIALEESDQRPLVQQVNELRWLVLNLQNALDEDRASRGLPPVEYPPMEATGS